MALICLCLALVNITLSTTRGNTTSGRNSDKRLSVWESHTSRTTAAFCINNGIYPRWPINHCSSVEGQTGDTELCTFIFG